MFYCAYTFHIFTPICAFVGAIGDVDGDGNLDIITLFDMVAEVTGEWQSQVLLKHTTYIVKTNLKDKLSQPNFVPMNATVLPSISSPADVSTDTKKLQDLEFEPLERQPWLAYMSTNGDSSYADHTDSHR